MTLEKIAQVTNGKLFLPEGFEGNGKKEIAGAVNDNRKIEKDFLFTIQAQKNIIKEQEERINGLKEIIERQAQEIATLKQENARLRALLDERNG